MFGVAAPHDRSLYSPDTSPTSSTSTATGIDGDVPYLRVGSGTSEPVITPDNMHQRRLQWGHSRPVVFLNGCRTTDLDPERAIDFVSYFVEDASASGLGAVERDVGVIGTETLCSKPSPAPSPNTSSTNSSSIAPPSATPSPAHA